MNTVSGEFKYDHILVRFGELSTKGKNKRDFIKRLTRNVQYALKQFDKLEYRSTHDRLYIMLNDEAVEGISLILERVFGISSFSFALKVSSDISEIKEFSLLLAQKSSAQTFKVIARRSDKGFDMTSDEINRSVASLILQEGKMSVDVHNPELRLLVEVHVDATYIMASRFEGAKGYPVGVGGKAMIMLSGGIDSPVAAYLMMKRGVSIECMHFASPPYTSEAALNKVKKLASIVSMYQGSVRLHVVPFTALQLAIYKNCDESYAITIMRRMMVRICDRFAHTQNALAIVSGDSIGQVASQTLESMATINNVTNMSYIRPCATMDKLEIIALAKDIDTYQVSIEPFEDCCTIFTPKAPVTKPSIQKAERYEEKFNYEALIEECINNIESVQIYPNMDTNTDIF